jgi:spoIIIJ-associated protein
MVKEFEGKSEKEAIDKAVAELNLERENFDVEVLESSKGFLFMKGTVRIRVHYDESGGPSAGSGPVDSHESRGANELDRSTSVRDVQPATNTRAATGRKNGEIYEEIQPEIKEDLAVYLETLIDKMGFPGNVLARQKESRKVVLDIQSDFSAILIGKKGKNLDALQLLVNVHAGRRHGNLRVIVDAEDYRTRREEKLVRMADQTAKQVRKTRSSRLLEPMNPFERRLIHTALNDLKDIETKSEGDGLFKQVRVRYTGK